MPTEPFNQESSHTDHVVGKVEEFAEGTHRVVEVAGRQIGIFNIRGEFHALPNVCPHQTGPLCTASRLIGSLEARAEDGWRRSWVYDGEVIACPWHGLEYHVPTGQCLAFPHIRLRRYPVSVENNHVVIRITTRRVGESR